MDDERALELISAELDAELSPTERTEYRELLSARPDLAALRDQLAQDRQLLRALPPLSVPNPLRQRALQKAQSRRGGGAPGLLWAAAVLLTLGLGILWSRQGALEGHRLHLHPGQLAAQALPQAAVLDLEKPHHLVSERLTGQHVGGGAKVRLLGDAGPNKGAKISVRLGFDFDGDGDFEVHSDPRWLELDESEGFQTLACDFDELPGMQDLRNGTVRLEFQPQTPSGDPIQLKLEPGQAHLELPFTVDPEA